MALLPHIIVMLAFYWLYNYVLASWFNKLIGSPTRFDLWVWNCWVWSYLKALFFIGIIPFVSADLLCMALLKDWSYSRGLILLPHMVSLWLDKRMLSYLKVVYTLASELKS